MNDFNQSREYLNYLEQQRENAHDLRLHEAADDAEGDVCGSVKAFADILFNRPVDTLNDDINLVLDERMSIIDIFEMLLDLTLHGINKLASERSIFDLERVDDPLIELLKRYILNTGFQCVFETTNEDLREVTCRGYCRIVPKPENNYSTSLWIHTKYALVANPLYLMPMPNLLFDQLKAVFAANDGKVYQISFTIARF